ncbi:unnamed protein product [Lathyrus oleraceus]
MRLLNYSFLKSQIVSTKLEEFDFSWGTGNDGCIRSIRGIWILENEIKPQIERKESGGEKIDGGDPK